jgi:hypothetical protein
VNSGVIIIGKIRHQCFSMAKILIHPNLSKMAADFLFIPSTSVPNERVFSKAGDLVTKKRKRLSKNTIKITMLLNSWSKVTKSI